MKGDVTRSDIAKPFAIYYCMRFDEGILGKHITSSHEATAHGGFVQYIISCYLKVLVQLQLYFAAHDFHEVRNKPSTKRFSPRGKMRNSHYCRPMRYMRMNLHSAGLLLMKEQVLASLLRLLAFFITYPASHRDQWKASQCLVCSLRHLAVEHELVA